MISMLKDWHGGVEVNGKSYDSMQACISDFKPINGKIHIVLRSNVNRGVNATHNDAQKASAKTNYRITVKQYMTRKACPEFDFMAKWNNDVPMPFCVMTGTIEKETRGMVYMKLHADIYAEKICTCMKCGRDLTNPVSQYFGVGPECGGHNYVNPFNSDEELRQAVAEYRKKLQNIQWEGWVIRSAITEMEEV